MTPTEATELAKRIINCWTGGPPLREWIDALTPLHPGRAGTAYIRLRNTQTHAPTIARYIAEYRTLQTDDPSTRTPTCPTCTGTGWTEAGWFAAHGHPYTASRPCLCPDGQRATASAIWQNAPTVTLITENEAEHLRTGAAAA
jgi:hypothetical protein